MKNILLQRSFILCLFAFSLENVKYIIEHANERNIGRFEKVGNNKIPLKIFELFILQFSKVQWILSKHEVCSTNSQFYLLIMHNEN